MKKYIGCDLGGTNVRAGIVDPDSGLVSHLTSTPTLAREGHAAVIERMARLFETIIVASGLSTNEIGGIGIGVPGALDMEKGRTVFLPNLPGNWPDVPLAATLSQLSGLPVYLINDARSITFGEWLFGAGQRAATMACFTIGTGIGGGLVINNKLYLGLDGMAGELGHIVVDYTGVQCGCGNFGCVETLASGPAITAMALKAITQGRTTTMGAMVDYDLNRINPAAVAKAALAGDAIAQDIYERAGFFIGIAAANLCVTITPTRIVIAGGVAQAGDLLLDPIRRALRERARMIPIEKVTVVQAQLGDNAGVIGAAMWAREHDVESK